MTRRLTSVLLCLWLSVQFAVAATFLTQRLEKVAKAVHLQVPANIGANAQIDTILTHQGKAVRLCTNRYGEVSHIGYCLFSSELVKHYQNESLFHFVERYLLELDLRIDGKSPELRMDVDQVVLTKGSLSQLRSLTPRANFSFEMEEIHRRFYRMTWILANGAEVSMVIPADCQLIMGANQPELELLAERNLKRVEPLSEEAVMQRWAEAEGYRGEGVLILDGGAYMSRYIRGDLYLAEQANRRKPLCSKEKPLQSVSNLMLTGISDRPMPVSLTLNRYGGKRTTMQIDLKQYIAFCLQEGCLLYFGTKKLENGELKGALFAYNERFAYTHLLDVTFPLSLLSNGEGAIKCTTYVYIPLKLVDDNLFTQQFERIPIKE